MRQTFERLDAIRSSRPAWRLERAAFVFLPPPILIDGGE
jgi:hypothetical protein